MVFLHIECNYGMQEFSVLTVVIISELEGFRWLKYAQIKAEHIGSDMGELICINRVGGIYEVNDKRNSCLTL